MKIILPERVKTPGMKFLQDWMTKKTYLQFDLKESDMILLLGGSSVWKLAKGLPLTAQDDIDYYFQGNPAKRLPIDCMRNDIGVVVSRLLGLSEEAIASHKDKFHDEKQPSRSFYLITQNGVDYNVGSREILSNVQGSIDLETSELLEGQKDTPHAINFWRFIHYNEIMFYDLPGYVAAYHQQTLPAVAFKVLSTLSFMFKLCLKPLYSDPGAHFDLQTAKHILAFKNKASNARLIGNIHKRLQSFYHAPENALDMIFEVAQRDVRLPKIHQELRARFVKNQTLSEHSQRQGEKIKLLQKQLELVSQAYGSLVDVRAETDRALQEAKNGQTKLAQERDQLKTTMGQMQEKNGILIDNLHHELLNTRRSEMMYQVEIESQCEMAILAVLLRVHFKNPAAALQYYSSGFQPDEYLAIINSGDPLKRMRLEVAAASLSQIGKKHSVFTGFVHYILTHDFCEKIPTASQPASMFLQLDLYFDIATKFTLSAQQRHGEIILYIHYLLAFSRTEFMQECHPNQFVPMQMLLALSLNKKVLDEALGHMQKIDEVKHFIERYHSVLSDYFEKNNFSGKTILSPKQMTVLHKILSLQMQIPELVNSLCGFGCERYVKMHHYLPSQFEALLSAFSYTLEIEKGTEHWMDIVSIWNSLNENMLTPPRKASQKEKEAYASVGTSRQFLRMFFSRVFQQYSTLSLNYLIKTHLLALSYQHTHWNTIEQWMKHPLVKNLSVILSADHESKIRDPDQWPKLIELAVQELKTYALLPNSIHDVSDEQSLRETLFDIIGAFLLVVPQNDKGLIRAYALLGANLRKTAVLSNVLSFTADKPLLPSQVFLQAYLKNKKALILEEADFKKLDVHFQGMPEALIDSLGKFFSTIAMNKLGDNVGSAFELCGLLCVNQLYMANLGKCIRFFKEKVILAKVGINEDSNISKIILKSLNVLPSYEALQKCQTQLEFLFEHIEEAKEKHADEYKIVLEALSMIQAPLKSVHVAKILTVMVPHFGGNENAAKLFKLANNLSQDVVPAKRVTLN